MGRGFDENVGQGPPKRNPFRVKILGKGERGIADKKEKSQLAGDKVLRSKEDLLADSLLVDDNLTKKQIRFIKENLDEQEIALISLFGAKIDFFDEGQGFIISKDGKMLGQEGDFSHYSLPSRCFVETDQNGGMWLKKEWLSDGLISRSPESGPSQISFSLDQEGRVSGSWSFRNRFIGHYIDGERFSGAGIDDNGISHPGKIDEKSPWTALGLSQEILLAAEAQDSSELAILYYLHDLDNPRYSGVRGAEEKAEAKRKENIYAKAADALLGRESSGKRIPGACKKEIKKGSLSLAIDSLLKRGLIEKLQIGSPWERKTIYQINPKFHKKPLIFQAKTVEEESGLLQKRI